MDKAHVNFQAPYRVRQKFKESCARAAVGMGAALVSFMECCNKHGVTKVLEHLRGLK